MSHNAVYLKSHFDRFSLIPAVQRLSSVPCLYPFNHTTNKSSGVAISDGVAKVFNDAQGTNDQGSMGIQKKCPSASVKTERTSTRVDGPEIP